MNQETLIQFWEQEAQRQFQGWDFSYIDDRYHEEMPPWSYDAKVRALLPNVDSLLDMGTGGGEKLLDFKEILPKNTFATEGYAPNLPIAEANLRPYGIQVVPYDSETDARMPFDDSRFGLIINRHEAFDAGEITRVLRPGGLFFTQQVDGHDMDDLYTAFGFNPGYPDVTLENFQRQVEAVGLQVQEAREWSGKAVFTDVGALVYYLHAVPWEAPADFSVQRYRQQLLALHAQENLAFTIRRFYVLAIKNHV